jgi:hypothetical protein
MGTSLLLTRLGDLAGRGTLGVVLIVGGGGGGGCKCGCSITDGCI